MVALLAIIPILYLLFRDTKAKVFLKPTEFQDLPLEYKEASFGLITVHPLILTSTSTISLLLMSLLVLCVLLAAFGRRGWQAGEAQSSWAYCQPLR